MTFWRKVAEDGNRVWRHLERHEPGRVVHQLYEGTDRTLGRLVPLQDRPETEGLAALVTEDFIITGITHLTATYIPNVRPCARWADIPQGRALGQADIEPAIDLLDALDEDLNAERRDVRLGKARLMVASTLLDDLGPGNGFAFDVDREVYEQVKFSQGQNAGMGDLIHGEQFDMRTAEWLDKIKSVVRRSSTPAATPPDVRLAGRRPPRPPPRSSPRSAPPRPVTASRVSGRSAWRSSCAPAPPCESALQQGPGGGGQGVLPPYTLPTMKDAAQVVAVAGDAMSTRTKVELLHPDWDAKQIDAEVAEIKSETPTSTITVVDPFGRTGTTDQPPTPESQPILPAA